MASVICVSFTHYLFFDQTLVHLGGDNSVKLARNFSAKQYNTGPFLYIKDLKDNVGELNGNRTTEVRSKG